MNGFAEDTRLLLRRLQAPAPVVKGSVVRVLGLRLETRGISAPLGACCEVTSGSGRRLLAEVVGFEDRTLILMPYEEPSGIEPGAEVRVLRRDAAVEVGSSMLGRVLDGLGQALDGGPVPQATATVPLAGRPPGPMERGPVREVLDVGVRAINATLTLGRGQRVGLIAPAGVGKSMLLGMMTRFTAADVIVIGLIGERGREVRDFVADTLGPEGLARSVVVAAPANESPVMRLKAAHLTHAIAEHFRDEGRHVLMLVDSLTRVAHAQRELGLAVGEPPSTRGYPPSVSALLPALIERGGVGRGGIGSITSIYTVLAEEEDGQDPIVELARASLDGQIVLSRKLANAAHYPAIDLAGSISRLMPDLVPPDTLAIANRARRLWTLHQQNEELIRIGAVEEGRDQELDEALRMRPLLEAFLRQDRNGPALYAECREELVRLLQQPGARR